MELPEWVRWIARNANGNINVFEVKPTLGDVEWTPETSSRCVFLECNPNPAIDWKDSLSEINHAPIDIAPADPWPSVSAPEFLRRAAQHMADRAAAYDQPKGERSMGKTVHLFNLHHGLNLSEAQGWHFMQILKDVRFFQNEREPHMDSLEDSVSYAALKAEGAMRGAA